MKTNKEILDFALRSECILNDFDKHSLWTVRQSILNLLEIIDSYSGNENSQELVKNGKITVQRLIAAVVDADKALDDSELQLIQDLFVTDSVDTICDHQTIHRLAEEWKSNCNTIPPFYQESVINGYFRQILIELQTIGNNISICDDSFDPKERNLVRNYISFLEEWALSQ